MENCFQITSFEVLPTEILLNICKFISYDELTNFALINKACLLAATLYLGDVIRLHKDIQEVAKSNQKFEKLIDYLQSPEVSNNAYCNGRNLISKFIYRNNIVSVINLISYLQLGYACSAREIRLWQFLNSNNIKSMRFFINPSNYNDGILEGRYKIDNWQLSFMDYEWKYNKKVNKSIFSVSLTRSQESTTGKRFVLFDKTRKVIFSKMYIFKSISEKGIIVVFLLIFFSFFLLFVLGLLMPLHLTYALFINQEISKNDEEIFRKYALACLICFSSACFMTCLFYAVAGLGEMAETSEKKVIRDVTDNIEAVINGNDFSTLLSHNR